jgi:hypothetical protein
VANLQWLLARFLQILVCLTISQGYGDAKIQRFWGSLLQKEHGINLLLIVAKTPQCCKNATLTIGTWYKNNIIVS